MDAHAQSIDQIFAALSTSESGLTDDEVLVRRSHGANTLPKSRERLTALGIFFAQWKSPLLLILLAAGAVSGFLREYGDMAVIFLTALINAAIGFVQEYKANEALKRLEQLVEYRALVIRNGKQQSILSQELVPGDVVLLSPGDTIQADGRIIEALDLEINEAPLTGESQPVRKQTDVLPVHTVLPDRRNMAYRGTHIVAGRGKMIVTMIGKNTEIGRIATLVQDTKEELTPLQAALARMSRLLGFMVIGICVGIIFLAFFKNVGNYTTIELFQTAVAVAIAAIPEGLLVSLTVILAIGMRVLAKRGALVRKLLAAETLGSVSVICTDKTGTMTEGQMKVSEILTAADRMERSELANISKEMLERRPEVFLTARIGVLCNNAVATEAGVTGNTTDVALTLFGADIGLNRSQMEMALPRISEVPFRSDQKYMATVHRVDHEHVAYVKGAPEMLLQWSDTLEEHGESRPITQKDRAWFHEEQEAMAERGLRVLAVAYTGHTSLITTPKEPPEHLIFVGLIGIADTLRSDVQAAVATAERAGIAVKMITGDHRSTAVALGKEAGIFKDTQYVIDGNELDVMDDEKLVEKVEACAIFARVSPRHKIRIVQALQARGHVVAMTGDGINDAPALKGADIGVAVGSGTDVAKETADLILLHNNFSAIVAAVEEGRRMYQNIKKVTLYLLVGSLSEVVLIVGSILFELPLALLPAQILWMNIIQEAFPTVALAFDPADPDNMNDPPRKRRTNLFDPLMRWLTLTMTVVTNILLFGIFWYSVKNGTIAYARTMAFVGLGVSSLLYLFAVRSARRHLWQTNIFGNGYVTAAVGVGGLLLLLVVYMPPLGRLLSTVPLSLGDWSVLVAFSVLNFLMIEGIKHFFVRRSY